MLDFCSFLEAHVRKFTLSTLVFLFSPSKLLALTSAHIINIYIVSNITNVRLCVIISKLLVRNLWQSFLDQELLVGNLWQPFLDQELLVGTSGVHFTVVKWLSGTPGNRFTANDSYIWYATSILRHLDLLAKNQLIA